MRGSYDNSSKQAGDLGERDVQPAPRAGQSPKTISFVERLRRIIFRVDEEGVGCKFAAQGAAERVKQQEFAKSLAVSSAIDCKAAHQRRRKERVPRQLPDDICGQIGEANAGSGKRVITGDGSVRCDQNKARGNASATVLPGLRMEIPVERIDTTRKCGPVVLIAEEFDAVA